MDPYVVENVANGEDVIGEDSKDDIVSTDEDDIPLEYKVVEASPEPEPLILQDATSMENAGEIVQEITTSSAEETLKNEAPSTTTIPATAATEEIIEKIVSMDIAEETPKEAISTDSAHEHCDIVEGIQKKQGDPEIIPASTPIGNETENQPITVEKENPNQPIKNENESANQPIKNENEGSNQPITAENRSTYINEKLTSAVPLRMRDRMKKKDRDARCLSLGGAPTFPHPHLGGQRRNVPKSKWGDPISKSSWRVSMFELSSDGWLVDRIRDNNNNNNNNKAPSRSASTKTLNLDEDIDDILKSSSAAVVSLGNIKLRF